MTLTAVPDVNLSTEEGAVRAARKVYAWFGRAATDDQAEELASVLFDNCHACGLQVLTDIRRDGRKLPSVPDVERLFSNLMNNTALHANHVGRDERTEAASLVEAFWRNQAVQHIKARSDLDEISALFLAGWMWYSTVVDPSFDAIDHELTGYPDGTPSLWVTMTRNLLEYDDRAPAARAEAAFAAARKVATQGDEALTRAERAF